MKSGFRKTTFYKNLNTGEEKIVFDYPDGSKIVCREDEYYNYAKVKIIDARFKKTRKISKIFSCIMKDDYYDFVYDYMRMFDSENR